MRISEDKMVGEMVAEDYRTAAVFESYGIDFCCKGNRPLAEVCEDRNIDLGTIVKSLKEVVQAAPSNASVDYRSWPADLLADYIEKKHHRYVTERTPLVLQYLNKISQVHGSRHPELFAILEQFQASSSALAAHMKKEELILFPFIHQMVKAEITGEPLPRPHFEKVENPVAMMHHEHDVEGERFRMIAQLTNNYTPPEDACNTYRVAFSLLKEFEDDLHLHIHLENNILFPMALELEKQLSAN